MTARSKLSDRGARDDPAGTSPSGHALWHWDPRTDRLQFSPNAARVLDCDPAQLPDSSAALLEYIAPSHRTRLAEALQAAHQHQSGFALRLPWSIAGRPHSLLYLDGTTTGTEQSALVYGSIADLPPEAAAASLAPAELALILQEHSSDGILVLDRQGFCVQANPASLALLQIGADRLLGQRLTEVLAEAVDELPAATCRFVRTGSDGNETTMELQPLGRSERGLQVYLLRDISERRRAEKTHAMLAAIVDSSEDAIVSKNLDGVIQFWNKSAQNLFGYTPEEAIGRHITMLIPTDRLHEEDEILARLRRGERVEHFETIRQTKDGRLLNISLSVSPMIDQYGNIIGASKIARDVTRQKQMETATRRSQELLTALVEAAPLAVMLFDDDGRIDLWNTSASRMFGWTREQIGAVAPEAAADTRATALLASLRAATGAGDLQQVETTVARKDGSEIQVALWSSRLAATAGEAPRQLIVAADVSERYQAQRALREQEQRLQASLKASRTGTFHWDIRTNNLQWDDNLSRLFGLHPDEAIQTLERFIERVHPDDRDAVIESVQRCAREGANFDMDLRVVWPDGSIHWLSDIGQTFCDADGQPAYMTGACVDITQRKQTEQALRDSEEKFRTLADNIAQFAWMADGSGWIFWYNQRWFDYTGTTLEQMQGWGWRQVHHPDHVDRVVKKVSRCFETGTVWEDTFPLRGADGQYRWFLSRAIPIRDETGRVTRWFGTNTDITERRDMEEALREADRRKDAFLATLAHELRNPLAPIVNGLELLRMAPNSTPSARRVLDTMARQTLQLIRLVDDLLEVSRISRNKVQLRLEDVPLRDVVTSAIESVAPLLNKRRHTLDVDLPDEPVMLRADPTRLAQIFANLLNNAVKFTDDGGHITMRASISADQLEVHIQDNGCGIAPDMLQPIFDMFTQTSSLEGGRSGLGIGLTLVKALVELHGGSVRAYSEGLGQGSEFVLQLPVVQHATDRQTAQMPSEIPMDPSSQRILVVDDNEDAAVSTAMLLEAMGSEVRTAYDGEEALGIASDFRPHVILLDLGMPRLNGYEAARRLRQAEWAREVVLIALTGWGQEQDRQRTSDAGFDHHLVKPVDPAALRSLLNDIAQSASGA